MTARYSLTLGVVAAALMGCSQTPRRPSTPPAAPSEPPTCAGGVKIAAPIADAVCKDPDRFWSGSCEVPLRFAVHNCAEHSISPLELTLSRADQSTIQWSFDASLVTPNDTWIHEPVTQLAPGTYEVVFTYESGATRATKQTSLTVRNTTLDAARRACQDCNGEFGARGMLAITACHCRTKDAGTPCDDGEDCEGKCVRSGDGFACSEFHAVFGCHSYLPDGWSEQPSARGRSVPHICVD